MNKMLLIVDPQIDFINGSMPVEGAVAAMDSLASYITEKGRFYSAIVITADRHPRDHCSFRENGGEWPAHCVAGTEGAEVWPAISEAVLESGVHAETVYKGNDGGVEEYSVFRNADAAARIAEMIRRNHIGEVEVCGLAGDICVLSSFRDGVRLFPECRFRVLEAYSPSTDGGEALKNIKKICKYE